MEKDAAKEHTSNEDAVKILRQKVGCAEFQKELSLARSTEPNQLQDGGVRKPASRH